MMRHVFAGVLLVAFVVALHGQAVLDVADTRPPLLGLTAILGMAVIAYAGLMLYRTQRHLTWFAWRAALRHLGWMPLVALGVVVFVTVFSIQVLPEMPEGATVVFTIMPLFVALQSASLFASDDEPALEIQLTAPRPFGMVIAERFFVMVVVYTLIGIVGAVLERWFVSDSDFVLGAIGWLPAGLFLGGVAFYATVRSRLSVFGIITSGLIWFLFGLFSEIFTPGRDYGGFLNLIQPFLWVVDIYATHDALPANDFILNRTFLTVSGIGLIFSAMQQLKDSEQMLFSTGHNKSKQAKSDYTGTEKKKTGLLTPVQTQVNRLSQLLGIAWYEMVMLWRGRVLKVMTITPQVMIGAIGYFYTQNGNFMPGVQTAVATTAFETSVMRGELLTMATVATIFVISAYILPLVLADRIPRDITLHTYELMHASPLDDLTYVYGKVLGVVLAGLSCLGLTAMISGVGWWFLVGNYTLTPFLDLMLTALVTMTIGCSVGVLIGATQRSSRATFALVIVVIIVPELFGGLLLAPSRIPLLTTYISSIMGNVMIEPLVARPLTFLDTRVTDLILPALIQLVLTALIVFAWRRYQSHKQ